MFKSFDKDILTIKSEKRLVQLKFVDTTTGQEANINDIDTHPLNISTKYGIKESSIGLRVKYIATLPVSIKTCFKLDKICVE